MEFSRRQALALPTLTVATSLLDIPVLARTNRKTTGNPLALPTGVCDPQIRVYGKDIWLYATHDAGPDNAVFTMHDWQIWRTRNLIDWTLAGTLRPEQTYFGKASTRCWATDAAHRNGKYYLYFSMGPEDIGVVVSDMPAGPWTDPLGKPLIAKGLVPSASRDPGILQEADGTSYIVFGTWDFYIARLNDDMVSLAEAPRKIEILDKEGPYGPGRTDDKPFLHRRGSFYYLSWGSYYGIGSSPYGPFQCKGALLFDENVDPMFRYAGPTRMIPRLKATNWLNFDRHASFFEWNRRWYFVCNDQSQPTNTPLYRNSVICEVRYKDNGDIVPLKLTRQGPAVL